LAAQGKSPASDGEQAQCTDASDPGHAAVAPTKRCFSYPSPRLALLLRRGEATVAGFAAKCKPWSTVALLLTVMLIFAFQRTHPTVLTAAA
jgi:hypothetical protein